MRVACGSWTAPTVSVTFHWAQSVAAALAEYAAPGANVVPPPLRSVFHETKSWVRVMTVAMWSPATPVEALWPSPGVQLTSKSRIGPG